MRGKAKDRKIEKTGERERERACAQKRDRESARKRTTKIVLQCVALYVCITCMLQRFKVMLQVAVIDELSLFPRYLHLYLFQFLRVLMYVYVYIYTTHVCEVRLFPRYLLYSFPFLRVLMHVYIYMCVLCKRLRKYTWLTCMCIFCKRLIYVLVFTSSPLSIFTHSDSKEP